MHFQEFKRAKLLIFQFFVNFLKYFHPDESFDESARMYLFRP